MGALNPQSGRSQIAAHLFVLFTYIEHTKKSQFSHNSF